MTRAGNYSFRTRMMTKDVKYPTKLNKLMLVRLIASSVHLLTSAHRGVQNPAGFAGKLPDHVNKRVKQEN